MSAWPRVIAHVDMDSFYASVEVRDNPSLAGRPLAVGGDANRRGVVSSASYEARAFGVRSAMPMARALQLCPDLIALPGNMSKYSSASKRLMEIFGEFSPLVEPLSLDEAFLDLTGAESLLGEPRAIGEKIRARIVAELSLTASVGMSTSKFVAKLASDHDKPDGLTVVPPERVVEFVQSLPLERLWGVGPATLEALHRAGIRTMVELARSDPAWLARSIGSNGARLVALARGEDSRSVVAGAGAKSISHEVTFARDQGDEGVLEGVILGLAEKVARRARRHGVSGRTVAVKVRLPDFTTFTRRRTLGSPTRDAGAIYRAARELFARAPRRGGPVRLIGVGLTGLRETPQLELDLFAAAEEAPPTDGERARLLQDAEDAIVHRFGRGALSRARTFVSRSAEDTRNLSDRPDLE